jgi:hypothetical protein
MECRLTLSRFSSSETPIIALKGNEAFEETSERSVCFQMIAGTEIEIHALIRTSNGAAAGSATLNNSSDNC